MANLKIWCFLAVFVVCLISDVQCRKGNRGSQRPGPHAPPPGDGAPPRRNGNQGPPRHGQSGRAGENNRHGNHHQRNDDHHHRHDDDSIEGHQSTESTVFPTTVSASVSRGTEKTNVQGSGDTAAVESAGGSTGSEEGGSVAGTRPEDGTEHGMILGENTELRTDGGSNMDVDEQLTDERNTHVENTKGQSEDGPSTISSSVLVAIMAVIGVVIIAGIVAITLYFLKVNKRAKRTVGHKSAIVTVSTVEPMPEKQHPPANSKYLPYKDNMKHPPYDDSMKKEIAPTKFSTKSDLFLSYKLPSVGLAPLENETPPSGDQTSSEMPQVPPAFLYNSLPPAYTRLDVRESSFAVE